MNAEMQMVESVRGKAVWGSWMRGAAALTGILAASLTLSSCSDLVRTGQSPAYLIMQSLEGAKGGGANANTFTSNLLSDVVTVVNGSSTVFNDLGQATLQLQLKDQGGASPNTPSPANAITITQYHVRYFRTDGRNVEGVDVPYAFDGATTSTISGSGTVGFVLVRNQAKLEAPLKALAQNLQVISTIAEVTFYGHDQNGREVTVTGQMDVGFANFGD